MFDVCKKFFCSKKEVIVGFSLVLSLIIFVNIYAMNLFIFFYSLVMLGVIIISYGLIHHKHQKKNENLGKLKDAIEDLAYGDFSKKIDVDSKDEISDIALSINVMMEQISISQEYLKNLNNELNNKVKQISHLLEEKNDFINQLSHDLRTPLVPLVNLLPLIYKKVDNKNKEPVEICIKNAKYLQNLVINTLKLAEIENNSHINKVQSNIHDMLEEINEAYKPILKSKGVKLINKINKTFSINVDPIKFRESLENIITNAIKYNDEKEKIISIKSSSKNDFAFLEITDNGVGIEKKNLERIFDEFFKVDPSRHSHESSGLGLSITKKIIESHKGKIIASSKGLNKGTTFKIQIPKEV